MTKKYIVNIDNSPKRKSGKSNKRTILKIFFLIFLIGGLVFGISYYLKDYNKNCRNGNSCNTLLSSISQAITPKLQKTINDRTNILVVGIDTRQGNSGLMNTDSMIVLTIDHTTGKAMMTSIPRDLWVTYELPNGSVTASKMNSIYAAAEVQQEGSGIQALEQTVEMVTGFKINYYVKVTLQGFVETIDAIGGIDLEVEKHYKDAYPASELPTELQATCQPFYHDGKYCIFEYPVGTHHLDGNHALIYARTRILSPAGDFDRAKRQQQVIDTVKSKILSSETLLDPTKLWDIFQIVNDNVDTSKFSLNDIRAGINLKDEIDTENIAQVVLDPNLGNFMGEYIYVGINNGQGYHIVARDETYSQIHNLLGIILEYPKIYEENPKISVYNATGVYTLEKDIGTEIIEEMPLINVIETSRPIYDNDNIHRDIKVYKFANEEMSGTEKYLEDKLAIDNIITEIPEGVVNYLGEDFVIIVGKDEPAENDTLNQ